MRTSVLLLVALVWLSTGLAHAQTDPAPPSACAAQDLAPTSDAGRWEVTFCNGDLALHGWLYKPAGDGPFPTVLYNHGSEKDPRGYLDNLAAVYTTRGFAFMAPFRRGHASSAGPYILDQLAAVDQSVRDSTLVQLHAVQLGDQLAGLAYLQDVAFVDQARIVVTGASFGGIQTILAAEANPGYRAAVDCAGAAQTWASSPALRKRLFDAISQIQIPMFLLQAENDYDTRPSTLLAAELERLGKPYRMQIYPPFGSGAVGQAGHNMCGPQGARVWAGDVFDFIGGTLQ